MAPTRRSLGDPIRSELRTFYDEEATARRRGLPTGRRVELLGEFVGLIRSEGRASVIDVGAGPATEAAAFVDAGVEYTGIDLSPANAGLALERGHRVVAASLFDPPFAAQSFEAAWSMSTLMHVPLTEFDEAMRATVTTLQPGAPFGIGMWGGDEREIAADPAGRRRFFSLRTAEHNRELLARHGEIERFETWNAGPADWEYQYTILRTR